MKALKPLLFAVCAVVCVAAQTYTIGGGQGATQTVIGQFLSCGPPTYNCSSTSSAILQLPVPFPAMGANPQVFNGVSVTGNHLGAGTIVRDNTNAPGQLGPRILRVTDANSPVSLAPTCPNIPANRAFVANYSGNDTENTVNSNSTMLVVGYQSGGSYCVLSFDPIGFKINGAIYQIPSKHVAWAHAGPNVIYAQEEASADCPGLCVVKYDLTGCTVGSCTPTITVLYDFAKTGNCLAGIVATWTSVFNTTYDDTQFTFGVSDQGGQETGHIIAIYKTGVGGGCRVANVGPATDVGIPALTITGNWGTNGPITFSNASNNGSQGESMNLHEVFGFGSDTWAEVSGSGCAPFGTNTVPCLNDTPFFWNVPTTSFTAAYVGGHFCPSFSLFPHGTGTPAGQFALIDPTNVVGTNPPGANLIPNANLSGFGTPIMDQHCSWNNSQNANNLFMAAVWDTVGQSANNQAIMGIPSAPAVGGYNGEITGYPTSSPGSATAFVHRFAHTWSSPQDPNFGTQYSEGTISQDGRFFVFTSDWECGVGSSSGSDTVLCGGTDWQATNNYVVGNFVSPTFGNNGQFTFHVSACTGTCTSGPNKLGTVVSGTSGSNAVGTSFVFSGTFDPTKFPVTAWAKVSGCTVAGYNGNWPITASSTTSVTVTGGSSGLGAATGCKVQAEWPQTADPATGTYTDNQVTWTPDGAQNARGDVFVVELL